jgi:hypothetical protein
MKKRGSTGIIILLVVLGFLVVSSIVVVSVILLKPEKSVQSLDSLEIETGKTINLAKNEKVEFELNGEEHELEVTFVSDDYIEVIIRSEVIQVRINFGEEKEIDVDQDGIADLVIRNRGNVLGKAVIEIKKFEVNEIGECEEDWDCTNWRECVDGKQERECIEMNNCGTEVDKPIEERDCEEANEEIINCGTAYPNEVSESSKPSGDGTLTFSNFDEDDALVCFGEKLLNDCESGEVKLIDEFGSELILSSEKSGDDCLINLEYEAIDESDEENLKFDGTYLECPVPIDTIPDLSCQMGACLEEGMPGQTAMGVFSGIVLDATFNQDTECSGTMIDKLTERESVNCQENWDCFLDQIEQCNEASFNWKTSIDLFGTNISQESLVEIKGGENNNCEIFFRRDDYNVEFTDEGIQNLLDQGYNLEEIQDKEDNENLRGQEFIGDEGICFGDTQIILDLFNDWKVGTASSSDWESFDSCEGEYMNP